jgi:hypothetical protein
MWQLPLLVHDEPSARSVAEAAPDPGSRSCPKPNALCVVPAGQPVDPPTGDPILPLVAWRGR